MSNSEAMTLAEKTAALRAELAEALPADVLAIFDADADRLAARTFDAALGVGDAAPDFTLPSAAGTDVSLKERLDAGPVVLVFYRGAWCPYCNLQLREYQRNLAEFAAAGARVVAVSPQTPDATMSFAEAAELGFDVLSDLDGTVMDAYGLVFDVAAQPRATMAAVGIDLAVVNGGTGWRIPVPATYVIGRDGTIAFAAVDGDYRRRAEAEDLLRALGAAGA